jgi:signal transduction histidine kinase
MAAIIGACIISAGGFGLTLTLFPSFPRDPGAWLSLAGLAGFVAASSYLISRSALRPLVRTRRVIERLSLEGLRERLYVTEVDDEPGRLMLELNALMDRVEDGMARHRQFVGAISHDIRTPLTIIKGDIEVALMRERSAQEYQEVLRSNMEEVERIRRLVEDLVTLARADYGELGLNVRAVSLAALAAETETVCETLGIPAERRDFRPHLTLARIRTPKPLFELKRAIAELPDDRFGEFQSTEFHLYKSELRPGGSIYTKLATYTLIT